MRQITRFIFIALMLASCNNVEKEHAVTKQDMPVKEKELRDAIAAKPDSLLLTENLIQYFRDNGNYDMAIKETDNAIKKDTANARLWDIKGTLHFENGDTTKGVQAMERSVDYYPEPANIILLGSWYAQTKNAKALEIADALLIGKKANAEKEALFIKGLYYSNTGDKDKAIAFFDDCIKLDYTFMFAYMEKAILMYNNGKYEEAITILNKATTLQNNFDEGYYWLGKCYEKLKKTDAAIESYKTALLYNPDYTEASDALGKLGVK